jgi:hypothetical protein
MNGRSAETWLAEVRGRRPRPSLAEEAVHSPKFGSERYASFSDQLGTKIISKTMQ